MNYLENWKKTPWRKVDVETMDIELKKFAKEIRGRYNENDFNGLYLPKPKIFE